MIRKNPAGIKLDYNHINDVADQLINYISAAPSIVKDKAENLQKEITPSYYSKSEQKTIEGELETDLQFKWRKDFIYSLIKPPIEIQPLIIGAYIGEDTKYYSGREINTGIKVNIEIAHKSKFKYTVDLYLKFNHEKTKKRILFNSASAALVVGKEYSKTNKNVIGRLYLDVLSLNPFPDFNDEKVVADLKKEIIWLVSHEVTHLSDYLVHSKNWSELLEQAWTKSELERSRVKYYNAAPEVNARINQFFTLVRNDPDKFKNFESFIKVIKKETAWKYYSPENKRRTVSALYTEWDRLHSKPQELTEFQRRKAEKRKESILARYLSASIG